MKPLRYLLIAILLVSASKAFADATQQDTVASCLKAISAGDKTSAARFADEIANWGPFFNTALQAPALECVRFSLGDGWTYSHASARFISPEEAAKREAERLAANKAAEEENARRIAAVRAADAAAAAERAAEAAASARARAEDALNSQRVADAVYGACRELFATDRVAALTNALCVDSFRANRLPE